MPDCKLQKLYLQTGGVSLKHERHRTVVAVLSESNLIRFYLWKQITANQKSNWLPVVTTTKRTTAFHEITESGCQHTR